MKPIDRPIEWNTRGKRMQTEVAAVRIVISRCGRFKIAHSRYKVSGMPDVFRALHLIDLLPAAGEDLARAWVILSEHRTFLAAQRALEAFAGPRPAAVKHPKPLRRGAAG